MLPVTLGLTPPTSPKKNRPEDHPAADVKFRDDLSTALNIMNNSGRCEGNNNNADLFTCSLPHQLNPVEAKRSEPLIG